MLIGIARKVGAVLSLCTLVPWLLIMIGFLLQAKQAGGNPGRVYFIPHWIISFVAIPLIILGVVHAAVSKPRATKILKQIMLFFSVIFLLCLGMIVYFSSLMVTHLGPSRVITVNATRVMVGVKPYMVLLFVGSLLAILTWAGQMMSWACYRVDRPAGTPYTALEKTDGTESD